MNTKNIQVMEVGGIRMKDYPDFVDAYIEVAYWKDTDKSLTDEELEELNSGKYQLFIYDHVLRRIF